jgi:hypothetical protein
MKKNITSNHNQPNKLNQHNIRPRDGHFPGKRDKIFAILESREIKYNIMMLKYWYK